MLQKLKKNGAILMVAASLSRFLNTIYKFNLNNGSKTLFNTHKSVFFLNVKFKIKGRNNKVIVGQDSILRNLHVEIQGSNNELIIGKGVRYYEHGRILFDGNNCKIVIGDKTTIGSANIFCSESNTSITVGNDCMFGRSVKVQTGDSHSIIDNETGKRINPSGDITIGNHVWIGFEALLLKGSAIANNSIVGAKCTVNRKFESENIILAGMPAKIVKQNINWDRKKLPY